MSETVLTVLVYGLCFLVILTALVGGIVIQLNDRFNVFSRPINGDPRVGMDFTQVRYPRLDRWIKTYLEPWLK